MAPELSYNVGERDASSCVECIKCRANARVLGTCQRRRFVDRGNDVPAWRKVTELIGDARAVPSDDFGVHRQNLPGLWIMQPALLKIILDHRTFTTAYHAMRRA